MTQEEKPSGITLPKIEGEVVDRYCEEQGWKRNKFYRIWKNKAERTLEELEHIKKILELRNAIEKERINKRAKEERAIKALLSNRDDAPAQ